MKTKLLIAALLIFAMLPMTVPLASTVSFPDVTEGAWYYPVITQMTQEGYLHGHSDGFFYPNQPATKSEFVKIVSNLAGLSPVATQSTHWAASIMQAALEAGWYDWDEIPPDGGTFDAPIERQLAAKIMMNALAQDVQGDYSTSQRIGDFHLLDGRYYNAVFAAYEAGILVGDDKGNFNPKGNLTRAESASMTYNAVTKLLEQGNAAIPSPSPSVTQQPAAISGGVSENGRLQLIGTQLSNEDGVPFVLRGMSSHGIQWYPEFLSAGAMKTLTDYGANLFRIAMYTAQGCYVENPQEIKERVIAAADAAIGQDMYVIIDWHILYDNNPNAYLEQAKVFFAEMAQRYKDEPAVIYEICNEPNGDITWQRDIRPYAMELIPIIRQYAPDSIIIVGTSTWSQDVDAVAANPLPYDNVMYALHFYAGTHKSELRQRVDTALNAGTPIFVSEWGTSAADGSGGVYLEEAQTWIDFMDSRNLSWANWSLCDKVESSAALLPGASPGGGWREEDLSASGKFVFSNFR